MRMPFRDATGLNIYIFAATIRTRASNIFSAGELLIATFLFALPRPYTQNDGAQCQHASGRIITA